MLLNFIRPTGNSTYKIYDPLGVKLLTRLRLGFSHLSEHKLRHNFADLLNSLCSCSLEIESTLYFFLRCQNYTTLRRAFMTDLKKSMIPFCICMKMTYFMLYCTETRILTATLM